MWEQRLKELGIEIARRPQTVGLYVPAVRAGNLVFTSGQLPLVDGKLAATGKVPTEVSLARAQAAARQAALNALAAIFSACGSLDGIARIVKLTVFVNSAPGFTDQAKVANGASELLAEIFGECGKHARCAVGAAELPLGAAVELELIAELKA